MNELKDALVTLTSETLPYTRFTIPKSSLAIEERIKSLRAESTFSLTMPQMGDIIRQYVKKKASEPQSDGDSDNDSIRAESKEGVDRAGTILT